MDTTPKEVREKTIRYLKEYFDNNNIQVPTDEQLQDFLEVSEVQFDLTIKESLSDERIDAEEYAPYNKEYPDGPSKRYVKIYREACKSSGKEPLDFEMLYNLYNACMYAFEKYFWDDSED